MRRLTKTLFVGAAAAMVAGVALTPNANAACWWAGGDWNCTTPPPPGAVVAPPSSGGPYYTPAPSWGFSPSSYSPDGNPGQTNSPGPKTNGNH